MGMADASFWRRFLPLVGMGRAKSTLGSTQNPSDTLVGLFGGPQSSAGVQVNDATAMRVATVYACVRVIAEDFAKTPPKLWRRRADGGRELARDHPLYGILRTPHRRPDMSIVSFLMAMGAAWGFRGNAIAVILRNERGQPTGLWPVHPGSVTLYEAEDGRLFYAISRRTTLENAVLRDVPIMVPDYDIFHVRGLTFDGIVGLSPLAQLREAIGVSMAGNQLSGSLLANGAQPTGVLKHKGQLSEPAAQRLRASWSQRHAGPRQAGTTAILEEGLEYEQLGMSSVDLQFVEQLKLTDEQICGGFRVPLHMVQRMDKSAGNNSQEASRRNYYDQTLMPIFEAFEAQFALSFDLPEDVFVEFDVSRLLRADFKQRQEGNRIQQQSGALLLNEWRIGEGRNPDPAGNVYARPLNTAYVNPNGDVVYVTPAGGKDPIAEPADDDAGKEDDEKEETDDA